MSETTETGATGASVTPGPTMGTDPADIAAVAEAVGPSVVRIGRGPGRGAGVVIGPDQVLTNAHNLRDRTTTVTFPDGRRVQGTVRGADPDGDLVVLDVDTAAATPVAWADVLPGLGSSVIAVNTLAGQGTRVTVGTVSAVGRTYRGPRGRLVSGAIEHTAPSGRGASGSPLLDGAGRLVALNTRRLDDGFYLARPGDQALRDEITTLAQGGSVGGVRLGVTVVPSHVAHRLRNAVGLDEHDGVLVRGVEPGSAAARAGIARGDLVVSAGGTPVASADDLFAVLDAADATAPLTLGLVRANEPLEIVVHFGAEPTNGEEAPRSS